LVHHSGANNLLADMLSRFPSGKPAEDDICLLQVMNANSRTRGRKIIFPTFSKLNFNDISFEEFLKFQRDDPDCKEMILFLSTGELPSDTRRAKLIAAVSEHYHVCQDIVAPGLLFRHRPVSDPSLDFNMSIVVPISLQDPLMKSVHESLCHPGVSRLYAALRKNYYYKNMFEKTSKFVRECANCQIHSKRGIPPFPVQQMPVMNRPQIKKSFN
jgi:hypothetical protein